MLVATVEGYPERPPAVRLIAYITLTIFRIHTFNWPSPYQSHSWIDMQNDLKTFVEEDALQKKSLRVPLLVFNEVSPIIFSLNTSVLMLSNTIYQLQNSGDVIMYSARWLNLNLSLSSFDLSVRGTRNMINFAHETVHVSRLKFILSWRNLFWMRVSPLTIATARVNMYRNGYFFFFFLFGPSVDLFLFLSLVPC